MLRIWLASLAGVLVMTGCQTANNSDSGLQDARRGDRADRANRADRARDADRRNAERDQRPDSPGNFDDLDDSGHSEPIVTQYTAGTCNQVSPDIKNVIIDDFRMEGLQMFGCAEAFPADASNCMAQFENHEPWLDQSQLQGHVVKRIKKVDGSTAYWLRSSADGRFIATGNGYINDLKGDRPRIDVAGASIDPVFSPDNKWYAWIGMTCDQSRLYDESIEEVGTGIEGTQCSSNSFNDYASVGFGADGNFLVFRNYSSTNYGNAVGRDTGMGGDSFTPNPLQIRIVRNLDLSEERIDFRMTGEEDYLLAPSGQLLVGRLADDDEFQIGYRVRMMRSNGNRLDPSNNDKIATICLHGEKPTISFDNRFVTFHHYTSAVANPAAANEREKIQDVGANRGSGNIFVYDLKYGKGYRVTNMPANSSALFPHFRADGWLIFQTKDSDSNEYIAATNAAIMIKKNNP